jgi:hypothetical protein
MGNHAVGHSMQRLAEEAMRNRNGESAMDILDRICSPYRGTDAEFESEDPDRPGYVHPEYGDATDPHPKAALGMLMVEAFAPNGLSDLPRYAPMVDDSADAAAEETACDAWWAEVYDPFKARYGFW